MDFYSAIATLRDGYAAKRQSWGGYVMKHVTSDVSDVNETYELTFVSKGGTSYKYTYDGSTWTAPSTKVPFDADIMAAMVADDWMTGKASAFEAARGNSGTW